MSGNIIGVKNTGELSYFFAEEIRTSKLNHWKGWLCSVGQYNISIKENGDMHGGDCGVRGYLGNVYSNFVIPTDWIVCPLKACSCYFDIEVPKKSITNNSEFIEFKPKKLNLKFEWFLSSKCNYECSYCPSQFHSKLPFKNSFKDIEFAIDNLNNKLNHNKYSISFWGGEPTLFPNYINICKKLHNYGIKIITTTNGSRSLKFFNELIKYSSISISVHEEFCDQNKLLNLLNNIEIKNNWLILKCMVKPNSLNYWSSFLKKLPNKNYKITLNSLTSPLEDGSNISENLLNYSEKELYILKKYSRLNNV